MKKKSKFERQGINVWIFDLWYAQHLSARRTFTSCCFTEWTEEGFDIKLQLVKGWAQSLCHTEYLDKANLGEQSCDQPGQISNIWGFKSPVCPIQRACSKKRNQMKQDGSCTLFNYSHTVETKHDNTGIHANSWFWDQSTQIASWKLAYCWIIHSVHQAGKKGSMDPG